MVFVIAMAVKMNGVIRIFIRGGVPGIWSGPSECDKTLESMVAVAIGSQSAISMSICLAGGRKTWCLA